MSDIRYICLSDMHLGEEDSLLTELTNRESAANVTDTAAPSQIMVHLVECLENLIAGNNAEVSHLVKAFRRHGERSQKISSQ